MPREIIDVTCSSCHKKNSLFKQLIKATYRCERCRRSHSDPFMSLTSQTKSALKGRNIVGLSVLVSVGIVVCSMRSTLASSQWLSLSLSPVTSQPRPFPTPPIVITKNRSLPSSTVLISRARGGGGSLKVSNGTSRDAYIKLVEPRSRKLVAAFYVKSKSTFTQKRVSDGTYKVLFVLGEDWDSKTRSFTKSKSFSEFDKSLNFTTTQRGNRIQYRAFTITLNPVVGGNATTSGFSETEFDRY